MGGGTRRASAVLLALVAVAAWLAYGVLRSLPEIDDQGRSLLYWGYGHSRLWWSLVAFSIAASTTYVLMFGLLWKLAGRTSGHRRGFASVVATAFALALGGLLALVGGGTALLVAAEGKQTLIQGTSRVAVVVTVDAFDGDIVLVWRGATSFMYVRQQERTAVDPDRGPCAVVDDGSGAVLTCGPTSQVLHVA